MTAPAPRYFEATQSGAAATLPASSSITTPQVGDLCVITQGGNGASVPAAPTYTSGGGSAGFTNDAANTSANGSVIIWSKVLTSSDFSGSSLKQFTVDASTFTSHRATLWVFSAVNLFGADRVFYAATQFSSIAAGTDIYANDSNTGGTPDPSRPAVVVLVAAFSTSVTPNFTWDGGTARTPYCDSSSSAVTTGGHTNHYGYNNAAVARVCADYNEYDSSGTVSTVSLSAGTSNTTHRIAVVVYQTAVAAGQAAVAGAGTISATGTVVHNATAAISGTGTIEAIPGLVQGDAAIAGAGTISATGKVTHYATGAIAGAGTIAATPWAMIQFLAPLLHFTNSSGLPVTLGYATVSTNLPTEAGDCRVRLYDGSMAVLGESAWTALTTTPEKINVLVPPASGVDFYMELKFRTLTALDPIIEPYPDTAIETGLTGNFFAFFN